MSTPKEDKLAKLKFEDITMGMNVSQTKVRISLEGEEGCPGIQVDKAWLLRLRDRMTELAGKLVDEAPAPEPKKRAEGAEARVKELKLKLVRQDEVAREAYEAAIWKYGQERMELEARVAELEAEALNGRHAVFTDLKAQLAAANEQNARLRGTLMRVTGSLGLVLKGAGIAAPAHKENYHAAKKLIEETFSGDREEAST